MHSLLRSIRHLLSELRRRNVYRVALAYLAAGFVVVELADIAAGTFDLPGWFGPMVWVVVGLGFPIALVLAWALEVTPEGVRVEKTARKEVDDSEEIPAPAHTTRELWVGASVLVFLLLGAWWIWSGVGAGGSAEQAESPEIEERSIAVLPFEVSGAGAEEWRDGMVTMLSMNLDGAAGLRAIADRRIFAAVQQVDSMGIGAGQSPSLTVAKRAGAKYAVIGSAVQLGEELRLGAEIREVPSGELLGQTEVEGPAGSITALTDRLTGEVLGVLLDRSEDRIPSVSLESITTESLEALKAFLRGEQHYRSSEYAAATQDYEAAVAKDSTFALAYARLQNSRFWSGQKGVGPAIQKAYEFSDRLPERERRIIRATHLWVPQDRGLAAADSLRRLSDAYPDDPSVWYWFGEVLYHNAVPRGLPEAETAFKQAIRLDPGVPAYHHHYVELAFVLHRDSAVANRRIGAHPAGPRKGMYRLVGDLVFGSEARQETALAGVDTIPSQTARQLFNAIRHPTDGDVREAVLPRLIERDLPADFYEEALVLSSFGRGKIDTALAQMREWALDPNSAACLPARSMSLGLPLPDSALRARLEPSRMKAGAEPDRLMCSGIYLVEKGREDQLPALIDRLRAVASKKDMSTTAIRRRVDEVKGYRAFRADSLQRAKRLLTRSNESGETGAIWRGDLYRKLGRLEEAEGWYLGAWRHPLAHERLGQLYEEMGKPEKARTAYERFIAAWQNADPPLQDRVEAARNRLQALQTEAHTRSSTPSRQ